jgi:predicted Zn-dependent protease
VDAALDRWSALVPLQRVPDPERAQVLLERRKPPLRAVGRGWRASNGRSHLQLLEVRRRDVWRFEPQVTVLVSPHLRAEVQQATALHELGHAFGLWGHSPEPTDAMAVHQGQRPVLELSERDRLTLRWVRDQPNDFGLPALQSSP